MKITKFGHSCLYLQLGSKAALFDPGVFSSVAVDELTQLDCIYITHEHPDHFDINLMKQLQAKFPDVLVIAPEETAVDMRAIGIELCTEMPAEAVLFDAPHEQIAPFGSRTPAQIGVHFGSILTHPGDSHTFTETMPVLGLPIVAPWGTVRRAVELALELKPAYVIPIHDWFLSADATDWHYERLTDIFSAHDIEFIGLKAGDTIELDEANFR